VRRLVSYDSIAEKDDRERFLRKGEIELIQGCVSARTKDVEPAIIGSLSHLSGRAGGGSRI
jgi:hypothetical protein